MPEMLERDYLNQRFTDLKAEAQTWEPTWKDIQKFIAPTNGYFDGIPNNGKKIDHQVIMNGRATRALNTLAAGMVSGLTSPSRPWFKLKLADNELSDYRGVRVYLDEVQKRMATVFSKSNIYGCLHACYREIGGFGTTAMILLEDFKDVVRGRTFTVGEYYIGTGPDGRVNAFTREYKKTVGQTVAEFGIDNVSQTVKNQFNEKRYELWITCRHLIEFNDKKVEGHEDETGKGWKSVYWEPGAETDKVLGKRGFEEWPILSPRWFLTTTADVYGKSPGWDALGDVKQFQKMEAGKLDMLDKVYDPPVQADADAEVNIVPGGLSRSSQGLPNAGVKPVYQIDPDFNSILALIQKVERDIDATFHSDLFLMISNSDPSGRMTAAEIFSRNEEKMRLLGPVLERLQGELLDPLIDRSFSIMLRKGLLPEPPRELQGMKIDVEYISILAQAQKMIGKASIENTMTFAASIAPVFPGVVDLVDSDEAMREYADMNGAPAKMIRSAEDVEKIRQNNAKAEAAAKQEKDMGAMVQGAKVLSDTKIGQGSALDQLLNVGG